VEAEVLVILAVLLDSLVVLEVVLEPASRQDQELQDKAIPEHLAAFIGQEQVAVVHQLREEIRGPCTKQVLELLVP
jgi:hypothetical protein